MTLRKNNVWTCDCVKAEDEKVKKLLKAGYPIYMLLVLKGLGVKMTEMLDPPKERGQKTLDFFE